MLRHLALLTLLCTCACAKKEASPVATPPAPEATIPEAYQDLSPVEFAEKMGDDNVVVLDVRTPAEIANGKIDGALELDFRAPDFSAKFSKLDPEATYLVYCAGGGRSAKTCTMLHEAGFAQLYNLAGGYRAWSQQ